MHDKKQPYVAKVALEMTFPEQRYFTRGVPLEVRAKGNGSSVPIANNTLPIPPTASGSSLLPASAPRRKTSVIPFHNPSCLT
jgi:hypothetical protein